MKIHQSNNLEVLADCLEKEIFQGSFFDRRYLILPSNFIKNWLFDRWAQKMSQVMALKTLSIQEAISFFLKKSQSREISFPTGVELELFIQDEITLACQKKDPIFNPLRDYVSEDFKEKIAFLSSTLAQLFLFYGQYGINLISQLEKGENWQEMIWKEVFSKRKLHIPIHELAKPIFSLDPCKIYLFAFSFIPPAYFDFFVRLSEHVNVLNFVLSPCAKYWEDVSTDYEERKVRKKFKDVEWLDSFFTTNELLANLGVVGKNTQKIINNYDLVICEDYKEQEESTYLRKVQNDILHLRKTRKDKCSSIRIIPISGTKFQEIQTLQRNLSIFFAQGFNPNDILILADDINEYLPFIDTIFGSKDIDYKISDIQLVHKSFLAKGILQILKLAFDEWHLRDLYQLFENPLFQKKFKFTQDDADLFYKLLKQAKLKFGYDENHTFYLTGKKIKNNTWKSSLQRLLFGLVVKVDEEKDFNWPYPVENIEVSQADLLNIFIALIENLWGDVQLFKSQSLKSWAQILEKIADKYFLFFSDDFIENSAMEALQNFIKEIKYISYDKEVELETLFSILQKQLQSKTVVFQPHLMDTIHFASLKSGNIKPAKIVYILGMNQEIIDQKSSLNLLHQSIQFYPTNVLKKRYLILELIILAKEKFILSYPKKESGSSKELFPSLIIEEMTSYFKDGVEMEESSSKTNPNKTSKFTKFDYPNTLVVDRPVKIIPISLLRLLVKDPFDFYLKQKFKMNFEMENENDFFLSPLNKYQFFSSSLEKDFSKQVDLFEKKALLPQGIFKEVAENILTFEMKSYQRILNGETIYQFQFRKDCKKPFFDKNTYIFPAISITLGRITYSIVGALSHVTKKGLVLFKEDKLIEKIRSWPSYLLYLLAIQNLEGFEPNLLFLKSKKTTPFPIDDSYLHLIEYLKYYFVATNTLSPFIGPWALSLLKKDRNKFEKNFAQLFREQKIWLINHIEQTDPNVVFDSWSSYLQKVFHPFI